MQTIKCPHCKEEIEISQALHDEVFDQIQSAQEEKYKENLQKALTEEKEKTEKKIREQFEMQLKNTKEEALEEKERREKLLEDLKRANDSMREMKRKEEEQEIENQKKLLEEREKLKEEISKIESEKSNLKLAEVQKQLDDTKKALEEAQRKSSQVSQQLQGEVLELQLEELLKEAYPQDDIVAVKKGELGADIRHAVKSPKGFVCGTILWEFKRTKEWKDKWLEDLKENLRNEKVNIPIIISNKLPKDVVNIGLKDGVWVAAQEFVLPIAELLRKNLLDVAYQKAVLANKTGKADMVYAYVTSDVFVHQVQSIVEVYFDTKTQIAKERGTYEKLWKAREEQAEKIFRTTAQIVGSISGSVGAAMPQIKGLELLEETIE